MVLCKITVDEQFSMGIKSLEQLAKSVSELKTLSGWAKIVDILVKALLSIEEVQFIQRLGAEILETMLRGSCEREPTVRCISRAKFTAISSNQPRQEFGPFIQLSFGVAAGCLQRS